MASSKELVALFMEGKLGELLVRRFGGKRGYTRPNRDSDFLLAFKTEEETPSANHIARHIARTVTEYYGGLGYVVKPNVHQSQECFQANIFYSLKEGISVGVVITTHYPNVGDPSILRRANLRVTCTIAY